jgi:hypothetical protein
MSTLFNKFYLYLTGSRPRIDYKMLVGANRNHCDRLLLYGTTQKSAAVHRMLTKGLT